ncbi:MAG: L-lactate dehydrogenase [Pseudomonadota bacterium]
MKKRKIGIVGTGNVGVAAAFALFVGQIANRIVLVDKDHARAEGEAMDIMHGQPLVGPTVVQAGNYEDLADAQIVVISAGLGQRPGETRLDLLNRNAKVFREIASELDKHAPDALLIIATNPVDVLTYVMQELTGRPPGQVIGTGTLLDTSRFRALLGRHYGVDPRSVHAYILGEHGDSEVAVWSSARVGNKSIRDATVLGTAYDEAQMQEIFTRVQRAADDIIARKGYTNWAIGAVISRLATAIVNDQRSILPVSVRFQGEYGIQDVCMSLPSVVGINGIEASMLPNLDDDEEHKLRASAQVLKDSLAGIEI